MDRNAADVMRQQAQCALAQPKLPSKVANKDKLFNALVDYLEGHSLFWRADEVDSVGMNFVKSLCDVLDSHHDTFSGRSPIPRCFASFQGFDIPEHSGSSLQELDLPSPLNEVYVRKLILISVLTL